MRVALSVAVLPERLIETLERLIAASAMVAVKLPEPLSGPPGPPFESLQSNEPS